MQTRNVRGAVTAVSSDGLTVRSEATSASNSFTQKFA